MIEDRGRIATIVQRYSHSVQCRLWSCSTLHKFGAINTSLISPGENLPSNQNGIFQITHDSAKIRFRTGKIHTYIN